MAWGIFVNGPLLTLTCHCTVGVGEPLAAAVKLTTCPAHTTCGAGCVVIDGAVADVITCSVSTADVLALKFVSPTYAAVIEWLPKLSVEVLKGAEPEINPPGPSGVVPSLKFTVPLGVPALGGTAVTVAVKVTFWPVLAGLADDVSVVAVAAWLTA